MAACDLQALVRETQSRVRQDIAAASESNCIEVLKRCEQMASAMNSTNPGHSTTQIWGNEHI
jgi:hypothetical protein